MAFTLNIQTEASVNAWKARAQALNEEAKTAIDEAMELLKTMPDVATGNFFNQVVDLGNQVCSGMIQVMNGMQELFNVVSSIVDMAKQVVSGLAEAAGSVAKAIMGG